MHGIPTCIKHTRLSEVGSHNCSWTPSINCKSGNWNRLVVLNCISIILLCIYLHVDDYIPIRMVIMLQRFFRDPVSATHKLLKLIYTVYFRLIIHVAYNLWTGP